MKSLFLSIALALAAFTASAETKPTPRVEYPKAGDYLIAELDGSGGYEMVRMDDFLAGTIPDCPGIQVFGDGRAVVCNNGRPREIQLSESELTDFIYGLLRLYAPELDTADLAARKRSDDEDRFRQSTTVIISADVPTYKLKLNLSGYAATAEQALRPLEISVSWQSVSMIADHYPNNDGVQRLAAIEKLFGELSHKIHQVSKHRGQK
ncbi:MAG: hypothetical protein HC897_00740 [Thermoanaerobaculia bacterium]|nr:hypothetical protein [Thermoanaerobaculia bacterium]